MIVPRHPSTRALHTLRVAKVAVVGAIATVAMVANSAPVTSDASPVADPLAAQVSHLMHAQNCSYTGFGPDTIPSTALIRTSTSGVKVVSFARGWASYEGTKPGTLIAVCLGNAAAAR